MWGVHWRISRHWLINCWSNWGRHTAPVCPRSCGGMWSEHKTLQHHHTDHSHTQHPGEETRKSLDWVFANMLNVQTPRPPGPRSRRVYHIILEWEPGWWGERQRDRHNQLVMSCPLFTLTRHCITCQLLTNAGLSTWQLWRHLGTVSHLRSPDSLADISQGSLHPPALHLPYNRKDKHCSSE